ncbi:MAG: glycine--tRNA ligase subunit beta, partial [Rickettsiales bacterium]|nr:glycine--tRNA ligase subunit beta [Rickettsiales bacterium]
MADLLLELFSEEIPARMQTAAIDELARRIETSLKEARLDFSGIEKFVTPRRLAVRVRGLPERQPDISSERKGPKVG